MLKATYRLLTWCRGIGFRVAGLWGNDGFDDLGNPRPGPYCAYDRCMSWMLYSLLVQPFDIVREPIGGWVVRHSTREELNRWLKDVH